MELSSYMRLANGTANPHLTRQQYLVNAALGLTGEAGELANAIKKWQFHGHELDEENVIEELGDIMWYVALACRELDITIDDVLNANINKLRRRYPQGFTYTDSINREI